MFFSKPPWTVTESSLEKESPMTMHICWLDSLAKAQETARQLNKPILLDFYNPQ